MKFNWTIFALPCALAAAVAASSAACTVTSSNPSDAGLTVADCSVNAGRFSRALREADGGAGTAADMATCKTCIMGTSTGTGSASLTCTTTAALSTGLMDCISECFASDDDPSACIYTAGGTSCGTDPRFSADYAAHYQAWENALFATCERACQLQDNAGDAGADGH